jgi:MFS family permease
MPLAGRFVDRFGARVVCALGALVMAASLVLTGTLFLVRDPRLLLIVASALAGNLFGRYSVGSLFGLIFLSHQAGAALGRGWAAPASISPLATARRSRWLQRCC